MPERRPRSAPVRGPVGGRVGGALLCVAVATLGRGALADDAAGPGAADTGTAGPLGAAPTVLPAIGVGPAAPDVRLGNLGTALGPLGGVPVAPGGGRAWTITPQLGITEEYSSAGTGLGGSSGAQYITTVQPSLAATGDTTRLHGELIYAPQLQFYQPDANQNQVAQNFNGRLLATLLPQTLFLDLRGSGAVTPITAGQAPAGAAGTTNLSPANSSQNYSFSVSPYALHRFGAWGTGEIGAGVSRTIQNALQTAAPVVGPQTAVQAALADLAAASNQNTTSYDGHVAFTTGEAFGRYNGAALAQASSSQGGGVLAGGYRDTVTLDNGYAVTRTITALATIGYERIHYSGTTPIRIDDAIWNAGVRLVPNADSTITVRYGHQDGLNSLLVDAGYAPTVRTHIYARYSTGLTTGAETLQNALASSDLDTLGNPVDHGTGAPLVAAGNFFGTQNGLFRTTVASLTGVLALDRDSVSLGINSQQQKLLSASSAATLAASTADVPGFGSSRGVYGSLNWSHQLRPDLQSTVYGQYGVSSSGGTAGTEQLVVLSAALSYALSKTLAGNLQYSYDRNFGADQIFAGANGAAAAINADQSLVVVSLVKSF